MIISVIGNAKSIFSKNNGNIIDKGDMVIRFNSGIIIDPKHQGNKTTTYAYSLAGQKKDKFGEVELWCTLDHSYDEIKEHLRLSLNAKPSNGIIILEKLKNNYKNHTVRIFGFDWKETKTWYKRNDAAPPPDPCPFALHDYTREKEYCLKMIEELGWELY